MGTRIWRPLAIAGVLLLTVGCGSDTSGPSFGIPYWNLALNHYAITLATAAPYDTATLLPQVVTATGDSLTLPYTVTYAVVNNDTAILVNPAGVIRANTTTTKPGMYVVVTCTVGNTGLSVTRADTVLVNVVAHTPATAVIPVRSLSIHPSDSTIREVGGGTVYTFPATVIDSSGTDISKNVAVYYWTPQNQLAAHINAGDNRVFQGGVSTEFVGHVMLHAEALVYGKTVADSFLLTVEYPGSQQIDIAASYDPVSRQVVANGFPHDTTFISRGGSVVWHNTMVGAVNDTIDVEFDDPTQASPLNAPILGLGTIVPGTQPYGTVIVRPETLVDGGGNIGPFVPFVPPQPNGQVQLVLDSASSRGRRFLTVGSYTYHSRFFPGTGVITVVANETLP